MRRQSIRLFLLLLIVSLAPGCASYTDETREIRSAYRHEDYAVALRMLEESGLKDDDKNRLLYRLERAMILDRMGERKKSRASFSEADKIADELYTVSISRTAASFLISDAQTDYEGEDYEKVAIHTMMALSFISDDDHAAARVEAKKINSKLLELNNAYDENKNRYGEDAFARYLAGIIYEAKGEWDDAIVDYARAIELYRGPFGEFTQGGVPDQLVVALARLYRKRNRHEALAKLEQDFAKQVAASKRSANDEGEVVVIHELGHIATKTTSEFVFGFGKQVIRFSFPVIRKRSSYSYHGGTGVRVEGDFTSAENVADMDAIASASLEDRRLRMIAKQSARLLAKGQLTEQAYEKFGVIGGIAANVFSAVTETADTRSWTLLPEAFYVSRVRLPKGSHSLEVKTSGKVDRMAKVSLKKDQLVILRASE